MNPINIIKSFMGRGGSPEQLLQQMMGNNSNPVMSNLVSMAKQGNTKGIENFARNIMKEQGRDFDTEFSAFMNNIK